MSAELKASRHDASLILTLSNPGTQNALEADMLAALLETLSTAERDSAIDCVILTGADHYFCASSNVVRRHEPQGQQRIERIDFIDMLHSLIELLRTFPKPVIAAVEGGASGAGLSLMLACDFIVAASASTFSVADDQRGVMSNGGAMWFLSQALPRQLVTEIVLTGKAVSATQLHQIGVINRLAAAQSALDTAQTLADELAKLPPNAIDQIKSILHDVKQTTLAEHLKSEKQAYIEGLHQNR